MSDPSTKACASCGQAAVTYCKGCLDADQPECDQQPTFYCSKTCQTDHWSFHMSACQAAREKKVATQRLFRAGELMQEAFLATRAGAFDLAIGTAVETLNGTIMIADRPKGINLYGPITDHLHAPLPHIRTAVLSYLAGGEAFTGMLFELGSEAFKACGATMEEIDIKVSASHLIMCRRTVDSKQYVADSSHYILRATMKDGSRWVVDLAGAQHGQHQPVLRFSEHKREYIEKMLSSRAYGASSEHPERPIEERDTKHGFWTSMPVLENLSYQTDELAEWQYLKNVTIKDIRQADAQTYQSFKHSLVEHLASAAREYVKLARHDPTSKAKFIFGNATGGKELSEEDKGRQERKRARRLAKMDPESRRFMEQQEAKGNVVLMF